MDELRTENINKCLKKHGIASLNEAKEICLSKGIDVESVVKGIQPIAFENAVLAYTLGVAIAIKNNAKIWIQFAIQLAKVCKHFVLPVLLPTGAKLELGMETLQKCF